MSIKLQIVAKQTGQDEFNDSSLSSFSVVNNPVSKFWTIPGGSFVPSNNGVLIVLADAISDNDNRQMIEDLIVQAIKYSIHDAEVDWGKVNASEILREAMLFAHQQLIGFKNQNEGLDSVLAQASIVLFRNERVHICWTGSGNIYRYSETDKILSKITDSNPKDENDQALSISIDNSLDGQLSDMMGSSSFQPMIKYIDAEIYQGDFIFGLSKGLMNLDFNIISHIIRANSSSSNMILTELLNTYNITEKSIESAVMCKVVQGKQFKPSTKFVSTPIVEELIETADEDIAVAKKTKPVWILNSVLVILVLFIVGLQITKWNATEETAAENTNIIEETVGNENLILLMAENFDIDSTSADEVTEVSIEETAPISINSQPTETTKALVTNEPKATPIAPVEKKTETKEKAENKEVTKTSKSKKTEYSSEIISLVNELETLKARIPLLMDYNEDYIRSMKTNALNKVQQGLTAAKYFSGKPGQKEVIENVINEANTEFRNLQITISNRSERD